MVSAAFEEAVRLGSGYAGPEHFLLALLRPDEQTVAAAALRDCGADHDRLSSVLAAAAAERPVESDAGVTLNPIAHELIGRALPPDAEWAWNVDGAYRAWVRATGDFDLRERVRQALDGAPA